MVFFSICDSGPPSATLTLASIVGAKSQQPLHGFRLSDLKWSMNSTTTHRFLTNSAATQSESDSDNRRAMARCSSPQAAKNGAENRMERTTVLDPAIAEKTAASSGGSNFLIRFRSKEKSSVVAEAEKEKQTHPQVQIRAAVASEPKESTSRVWNLRQRKPNSTKSAANSTIGDPFGNDGAAAHDYAAGLRKCGLRKCKDVRSEGKEEEKKVTFSIALTKEEIEEDFLIFAGKKPPRRPKKRPRTVQKQVDYVSPGLCLASTVTPQTYDVTRPAP